MSQALGAIKFSGKFTWQRNNAIKKVILLISQLCWKACCITIAIIAMIINGQLDSGFEWYQTVAMTADRECTYGHTVEMLKYASIICTVKMELSVSQSYQQIIQHH